MSRLATALCVLALACAAALPSFSRPSVDPDWFWHVRLGQTLLAGGAPVAPDEVSYASARGAYRRSAWAADQAFARLDGAFGIDGYRAGRGAVRAALVALVALACLRAGRSRAVALGCASLALPLVVSAGELSAAALGHVILASVACLTFASRRAPPVTACAAVVALQAALTNIHPLSVLLLAWTGALWAGAALERRLRRRDPPGEARDRATRYLLLTGTAFLALAADPRPFSALESILLLRLDALAPGRGVAGMLPPQMSGWVGWLGIAIGLLALAALARSRRGRPDEWLLLLGTLALGLERAEDLVPLEIVALPLLARHLPGTLLRRALARARLLRRGPSLRPLARAPAQAALAALALAASVAVPLALARRAPLPSEPTEALERAHLPARAADWVAAHVPPAREPRRVLVPFDWGGFLSWRLGPSYRVFQYGQGRLFPPAFWDDFVNHRPEAMRRRMLAGAPEVAVVRGGDALWRSLLLDAGWRAVYDDGRVVVLLPPEGR